MAPLICVVVPTYKRPQLLKQCLGALYAQDLRGEFFEIVVADDGPSAANRALVEDFDREFTNGPAIRYVPVTDAHGPAAARNSGWRNSRADFIAFTDDDCQPQREWLRHGLQALEHGADAAWGKLVMPVPARPTDYEKDASHLAHAEFVTANCFCRKTVLERIGGFDERFRLAWREDSDLFFNLLNIDANIVHAPDAVVVHPVRPAPWGVSLSQQRKTVFDALLYKKHPQYYRSRIRPSPPWNYYVIVVSLAAVPVFVLSGNPLGAGTAAVVWSGLTAAFLLHRLRGTARTFRHVAEMVFTSALIPPLALYWHWRGAFKFRVLYV